MFSAFSIKPKPISDMSKLGKEAVSALSLTQKIEEEAASGSDYNLTTSANQLYLNIDDLYKQASYLSLEGNLPISIDFNNLRRYLANLKILASGLPDILEMEKKVNYLVINQDNSELRPTGGKILSLALFTFEKGKLTNKANYEVTDIDSQLKGHIDPPNALTKYLGITNWQLKDANWDPDFRETAAKIEWFLENTIKQPVDGVIAINSSLYDKLEITNIFDFLKSKDIQIYLNDDKFLLPLNNLNWDGGINVPSCVGNCLSPWLGVIEANLGGNKVNSEISRSSNLLINLTGNNIENRLEINYKNLSNSLPYRM